METPQSAKDSIMEIIEHSFRLKENIDDALNEAEHYQDKHSEFRKRMKTTLQKINSEVAELHEDDTDYSVKITEAFYRIMDLCGKAFVDLL